VCTVQIDSAPNQLTNVGRAQPGQDREFCDRLHVRRQLGEQSGELVTGDESRFRLGEMEHLNLWCVVQPSPVDRGA
jgi:hypothetical protein